MSDEPRDEQGDVDPTATDVSTPDEVDELEQLDADETAHADRPEELDGADDPDVTEDPDSAEGPTDAQEPDDETESDDETEPEPDDDTEPEPEPEPEPTWIRTDLTDVSSAADAVLDVVERGGLVVLPTDTVYGIAADAYNKSAVASLLRAKERGRDMPPPVLVADAPLVKALAKDVPSAAEDLMAAHWPGPLTVILNASASLGMDLGETDDTVGVRVPDHDGVREVLRHTGPLAVSSANKTGRPAATTADGAIEQLGNAVDLYVDGGDLVATADAAPSSMVDFSKNEDGVVVRVGALSVRTLRETVPGLTTLREEDDPDLPAEDEAADTDDADETPVDESGGTDGADQVDTTDEAGQPDETDGTDQTDQADETDEVTEDRDDIAAQIHDAAGDETELPGEAELPDETEASDEGEPSDGAEASDGGETPGDDDRPVH